MQNQTQTQLFTLEMSTPLIIPRPGLTMEYSKQRSNKLHSDQYLLICEPLKLRLKQAFSFSMAIAIRERSVGFDWRLLENGKPSCWRELRALSVDLTGVAQNWEVEIYPKRKNLFCPPTLTNRQKQIQKSY